MQNVVSFTLEDYPGFTFHVDDSGPECYPETVVQDASGRQFPLPNGWAFHGVHTFDPDFDRECIECGRELGPRDWGFCFVDGEYCEACAGVHYL